MPHPKPATHQQVLIFSCRWLFELQFLEVVGLFLINDGFARFFSVFDEIKPFWILFWSGGCQAAI